MYIPIFSQKLSYQDTEEDIILSNTIYLILRCLRDLF